MKYFNKLTLREWIAGFGVIPGIFIADGSVTKDKLSSDVSNVVINGTVAVPDITLLSAVSNATTIVVKDPLRGGIFNYYTSGYVVDGGVCANSI